MFVVLCIVVVIVVCGSRLVVWTVVVIVGGSRVGVIRIVGIVQTDNGCVVMHIGGIVGNGLTSIRIQICDTTTITIRSVSCTISSRCSIRIPIGTCSSSIVVVVLWLWTFGLSSKIRIGAFGTCISFHRLLRGRRRGFGHLLAVVGTVAVAVIISNHPYRRM